MPTTTVNKQRVLTQLFTLLKKRFGTAEPEPRPVMEQLIYAVCREGTTREKADRAYRNLLERFFDWNEIRVSSSREVEESLRELPDPDVRAQRIIALLQEVFETTFSYDLEPLHKKGVKQAAKQLARFTAANDHAVAWVIQQSLGGHAIPLDNGTARVVKRLGLVEGDTQDMETFRSSLEHLIPKPRGAHFVDLISYLADDTCGEEPSCSSCALRQECPSAQESGRGDRPARAKPR